MTQSGYLFLGLTAIVAALSAVLAYAVLRIFAAARAATRDERRAGTETAFMAAAMEDAVRKLRDGERAMKARAEASERLSSEIVASMTSGLLVVDGDGHIRTLNPAGQTMLGLTDGDGTGRTGRCSNMPARLATCWKNVSARPRQWCGARFRCRPDGFRTSA